MKKIKIKIKSVLLIFTYFFPDVHSFSMQIEFLAYIVFLLLNYFDVSCKAALFET